MEHSTALRVEFWASEGEGEAGQEAGIDEFRAELDADYVAVVQGKQKGLGGGVLHVLVIEVLSTITLAATARLLLEGMAFDLIKAGAKSLVLRPLLRAFENLKQRNKPGEVDVTEFKITFQDAELKIRSVADGTLTGNLEGVLYAVAMHYDNLRRLGGDSLSSVTIPVFEDRTEERASRFREIGEIEEPIIPSGSSDYLGFWGVEYGPGLRRVYDVKRQLLVDEHWLTLMEYYEKLTLREMVRRST